MTVHCPSCLRWVEPDVMQGFATMYGRIPDWEFCPRCGWFLSPPDEQVSA